MTVFAELGILDDKEVSEVAEAIRAEAEQQWKEGFSVEEYVAWKDVANWLEGKEDM